MKKTIQYILIIILALILFSNFISNYRSFDTYRIETMQGLKNYAFENSFNDGRIFIGCIFLIADFANIEVQTLVTINTVSAILILGCCVIYLNNIVTELTEKKNLELFFIALSFLYYFNFMIIDGMQYLENIVIAMSIMLYTIAAKKMVIDQKYIVSLVLVIIGMFFYQATICCFLQLVLLLELLTNKKIKNIIHSMIISLIAIISNFLYIYFYGQVLNYETTRINTDIFANITKIFANFKDLIVRSSGTLYDYVWLIFMFILLLIILIYSLKNKKGHKIIIEILIISIYSIAIPTLTLIISDISFYDHGRCFFSVGALIPTIFMYIAINTDISKDKMGNYTFLIVGIIYFIVNMFNTYLVCYSYKRANEFDKEVCDKIVRYIEEYENKNNINIEGIAVGISENGIKFCKELLEKQYVTWNNSYVMCGLPIVPIINLYCNKEFESIAFASLEEKLHFNEREKYEFFDSSNICFIDNIACIYIW